jgi:CRP-like cAMP-binding protein
MELACKPEWLSNFLATLRGFTDIPDADWEAAQSRFTHLRIPKDGFFLKAGDAPDKLAFIASGVFRVFFVTESGDERIMVFREEGRLISAFSPFLTDRRAWFSIQALEDADLVCVALDGGSIAGSAECWKVVYAKYVELLFLEKETREREFLSDDAETRYRNFRAKYPGLENRIAQYHVASYLGITPVALSRIKKNMTSF